MTHSGWRAILFDLDGTLRYNTPAANDILLSQAVLLGAADHPTRRQRALRWAHFYWANSPTLLKDLHRYPERSADFWVQYTLRQLLAFGCTYHQATRLAAKVQKYMEQAYQPEDRLFPGLPEMLHTLRESGYRLGVLSNRPRPFHDYMEEKGLVPYFDLILAAGEVGVWKPSARVFQAAAERMRVSPTEVVYVGDNYFADVVGARRAGLFPVLIDAEGLFAGMDCPSIATVTQITPSFLENLAEGARPTADLRR
ncbi:MAG: hypothetical protein Fur0018_26290 [Anaerolineales bacterium]